MNRETSPCWFKQRNYIHFDSPLSLKNTIKLVTNPACITKHSFYPFIKDTLCEKKINSTLERDIKKRPVLYASHADSHIYSYYAHLLSEKYEKFLLNKDLANHVLAFRKIPKPQSEKNMCNIDFANYAFKEIVSRGNCVALVIDIKGFFDNLDHEILKKNWINLLEGQNFLPEDHYCVYKSLTKYSFVEKEQLYKNLSISKNNHKRLPNYKYCHPSTFRKLIRGNKLIQINSNNYGIPQGSPISGVLSNMYMLGFDQKINELIKQVNGTYYRYCDDMLFIVPEGDIEAFHKEVSTELLKLKLEISENKTQICKFNNGMTMTPLQYLGFLFDGKKIILRSKSISKYLKKMKKSVKLANSTRKKYNNKNGTSQKIYRRKIYIRYSHKGRRNFIQYGHRAAKIMDTKYIKKQLKPFWKKLKLELDNADKES
ncbi:reverse transcriptase/maturase family protein [Fluoribacter dumoffii]|uniref:antiviral reverse transcriptase Drt2 n=1 Tax=Fluoribacter dumoffii TaxID=463 RepID=UPI0022430B4A|nr:antiviral reverse transcriptase Drt2 [Fluoribacter dumoffii]MCW8417623.1 reverse transcriptase/maturase family protein [Fluoribacter dumoffii]MCW8454535.1 reverse transcriptase/maturase family protein [Fluoribacter dumoffii]MCW8461391.1 reverse transcriptase/maturase family protein [Fluoribacter dumoffii]MCW8484830.1 reverse transcriptase/maturase family protein [Fluoribacter dumoffii]